MGRFLARRAEGRVHPVLTVSVKRRHASGDNVLHTVLVVLGLLVAAVPAPGRRRGGGPPDDRSMLERYGAAYDASSPNQVFVGLRGSAG